MNYELAKQLKDAGFPQKGKGGFTVPENIEDYQGEVRVYIPTLEELIEACGGKFGFECLIKEPTGESVKWPPFIGKNPHYGEPEKSVYRWKATAYQFESDTWFEGSTPTEAVAHLYLQLNKPI